MNDNLYTFSNRKKGKSGNRHFDGLSSSNVKIEC